MENKKCCCSNCCNGDRHTKDIHANCSQLIRCDCPCHLPEQSKECEHKWEQRKFLLDMVNFCPKCEQMESLIPPTPSKSWEEEFDKEFGVKIKPHDKSVDPLIPKIIERAYLESFKVFIRNLLSQNSLAVRKELELLIAEEANIARSEGEKTSRLTSLFNKMKEKINVII